MSFKNKVVDKLPGFLSPEFSADNDNNEHELGMSEDQNKQLPLKRCEVLHITCITSLTDLSN